MTWLSLLLLGVAVVDLVRGRWAQPVVPEVVGALTVLVAGALVGAGPSDVVVLLLTAVVVVGWSLLARFATTEGATPRASLLALAVLGGGVALTLLASPWAPDAGGPFETWARKLPWSAAADDPERLLLVAALLGVQLATGNLVVRLVLAATSTAAPDIIDSPDHPPQELKGGRLLGPMERVLILGLGLAGQVTAASIVIAAKGLLRWPELQSPGDQAKVHRLTEYFLVGSFVSWSLALGSLALVAR